MGIFGFIYEYGGIILAVIGMALLVDEPEKFGKALLLQMMPASQGLYGFVIAILTLGRLDIAMSLQEGLFILMATLPMTIVGGPTAIAQANVAISGVHLLVRNENEVMKNIIMAVMVETYALLAFVSSIIILTSVTF